MTPDTVLNTVLLIKPSWRQAGASSDPEDGGTPNNVLKGCLNKAADGKGAPGVGYHKA